MTKSPEYATWVSMKKRCYYQKTNDFARYGGSGIRVCDEWKDSFEAFYAYMGPKPSLTHTIDRLDSSKNYEPGNVRWATWKQQCESRSKAHPPKPLITKNCIECHEEFTRTEYDMNRFGGLYCSNRCSGIVTRRKFVESGHKLVNIICGVCGKEFTRSPYQVKHRKTMSCSLKCRTILRKPLQRSINPTI